MLVDDQRYASNATYKWDHDTNNSHRRDLVPDLPKMLVGGWQQIAPRCSFRLDQKVAGFLSDFPRGNGGAYGKDQNLFMRLVWRCIKKWIQKIKGQQSKRHGPTDLWSYGCNLHLWRYSEHDLPQVVIIHGPVCWRAKVRDPGGPGGPGLDVHACTFNAQQPWKTCLSSLRRRSRCFATFAICP